LLNFFFASADALVLRIALERFATLLGGGVLRVARVLRGFLAFLGGGGRVSALLRRLHVGLGVALGGLVRRLRVLLADVLGVALHVVALFLGDVVGGIGLRQLHLLVRLRAGLVLRFQFGLGDLLLALGVGLAEILRIAVHAVAGGLVGLVLRLDLVLGGLVRILAHRGVVRGEGASGEAETEGRGQSDQVLLHGSISFPEVFGYFPSRKRRSPLPQQ
jgi:hypothetical protein